MFDPPKPDEQNCNKEYRTMSAAENEKYSPFLFARDGYVCTKKHGYGCGRTIQELLEMREIETLQTGRIFQTKVYVIDHINGNSHQRDGLDGEYCGNLEIQCWSCNRRKGGSELVPVNNNSKEKTQEKMDSIEGVPALINWTSTKLIENEEMCFQELIAASRQSNGLSPVTNERNIEYEIASKVNPHTKFQIFDYDCGSRLCNHHHICHNGHKPIKLIATEKKRLLEKWTKEYGISKDQYQNKQTMYDMHKQWMTFDEYVLAYGHLLLHDFSLSKFDESVIKSTQIPNL